MNYRRVSRPPEEIARLLSCINAFPETDKIESILEELEGVLLSFADDDRVIRSVDPKNGLIYGEKVFDLLGKDVFGFMFEDLYIRHEYFEAHNRFLGLLSIRTMFLSIAQTNNNFRGNSQDRLIRRVNSQNGVLEFSGPEMRMKITSKGFIKPFTEENILIELFKNFDIPFERIRLCPICQNIFWKARKESPTCSRKCSNNFHQKKNQLKNQLIALNEKRNNWKDKSSSKVLDEKIIEIDNAILEVKEKLQRLEK